MPEHDELCKLRPPVKRLEMEKENLKSDSLLRQKNKVKYVFTAQHKRPSLLTVWATIAGLLPVMFGSGTCSEVMRRIAASMVGVMVSAIVLALFVLPVLFLLWCRSALHVGIE